MRLKIALLAAGLGLAGLTALPASAQAYYPDPCQSARNHNQVGGALLGGILGGVLGSNVSARGHRGDGTAVGAGLGAIVGAAAGSNTRCVDGYASAPPPPPVYNEPVYQEPVYADPVYRGPPSHRHRGVADRDRYSYNADNGDYAGSECTDAQQITRLPDGSEIRKPVEACRETYHGGWTVRD